jgi:hypothetical protein
MSDEDAGLQGWGGSVKPEKHRQVVSGRIVIEH